MGLNDRQIEQLAHAAQAREYYVMNTDGRRIIDLGLGPVALAFVAATGEATRERILELKREFGEEWPAEWLGEQGEPEWGDFFRKQL